MKSKQDLKSFFENGDRPNQEQFWALIESYFHKDEPITLEELSMLKANLATIDKTNDGTEIIGNVDTKEQVNAKINAAINALKANAPETYDTLKEIADYIANDSNAEAALLQLINTKLDKPTMTNNYYGLWDDSNKKFVNGIVSQDTTTYPNNTKLTIGGNGDSRSKALIRLPAGWDLPYFNFGGTYLWETGVSFPSNLFAGDIFGANGKLWLYGYNQQTVQGGLGYRKLVGLEYDDAGYFNTPWNFNTYGEDWQSKGFAQLLHTGSYYEGTIVGQAPTSVGVSNRFRSGVLFNFTINGIKQQMYLDENGISNRRLNYGDTTSNNWNYSLVDYYNKTTTLGSNNNYTNIKWAVDSTTQGALIAPRMTQAQRLAITLGTTQEGAVVYQTDGVIGYYLWNGTSWNTLGSNIATADLTNTSARTFTQNASFSWNTLGNPHIVSGLPDKNSDITNFRKVRVQNTSGLDAVVDSKNLLTDGVTSMTDAEKDAWRLAQRKTNELYNSNAPVVLSTNPVLIKNTNDYNTPLIVIGQNLFINLENSKVYIKRVKDINDLPVTSSKIDVTSSVNVNSINNSIFLIYYNFFQLPTGYYEIEVINHLGLNNLTSFQFLIVENYTEDVINPFSVLNTREDLIDNLSINENFITIDLQSLTKGGILFNNIFPTTGNINCFFDINVKLTIPRTDYYFDSIMFGLVDSNNNDISSSRFPIVGFNFFNPNPWSGAIKDINNNKLLQSNSWGDNNQYYKLKVFIKDGTYSIASPTSGEVSQGFFTDLSTLGFIVQKNLPTSMTGGILEISISNFKKL